MHQKKLASIQWQFVRQGALLAALATGAVFLAFYIIGAYLNQHPVQLQALMVYFHVPALVRVDGTFFFLLLLIALAVAVIVGIVVGYIVGNLLKKRLHILLEAGLNLQRGILSYRLPDLGDDELGMLALQTNGFAARWEEQVASLQRLSTHNAELGEQVRHAAVTEERQRLARELHDAVSQQLFAIAMTTAAIKRLIGKNPERAAQQIELVEEMAAAAQSEMRALLLHLRPATLQNKSLKEAVTELLDELTRKQVTGITWELGDLTGVPNGIEDHLFRILQEALSNALRHAKANMVTVKLFSFDGQVRLRVADDGVGFDPDSDKMTSYGLVSMKERVNEIGGSMEIYTAVGKGTQIEVRVPLVMEAHNKGGTVPV
ncbi:sensor histidine kinase [Brevibacillus dissolubilis]|uniref:sensor histidine kinase n=1 Tax=Brevibacillus dissolubilis TaxID=1844116 RepID=UPI00159BC242|nr:sensor histidine kinase [Brevibacillus dissolubilis]